MYQQVLMLPDFNSENKLQKNYNVTDISNDGQINEQELLLNYLIRVITKFTLVH